ncbi:MAG TPA: transglutaminase-like cysteine peptidase [Cellvibrio sp.]|nr:transglutaminase-like cysteine peptidase [Cellvibrio sp.]
MKPGALNLAVSIGWVLLAWLFFIVLWSTAAVDSQKAEKVMQSRYGIEGVKQLRAWQQLMAENHVAPPSPPASSFSSASTSLPASANSLPSSVSSLSPSSSISSHSSLSSDSALSSSSSSYSHPAPTIHLTQTPSATEIEFEKKQIKSVNDFFNKHIRFVDDIYHWKQNDYWATPLETLGTGSGDCEDYTIAKYISLIQLGIPIERLRLIYVKAQIGGASSRVFQAHMVLGYYPQANAIPLILDSLISDIESADRRRDLHPVFSFNSEGLWVGNQAQPQIDPTARLSRWRDVLTRMKQEGF